MRTPLAIPLLLSLGACMPQFPEREFVEDPEGDFDGDGFTELDGDCDDSEALAFPGGEEVCDGIDNDCDGDIDDADGNLVGATPFYGDSDGDGYGGGQYQQDA